MTVPHDAVPDAPEEAPATTPLAAPADGVPPIVDTPEALREVEERMAAGKGPVAVDAERASGTDSAPTSRSSSGGEPGSR